MRLFLSSHSIGSEEAASRLASMLPGEPRVAVILNALDSHHPFVKEDVLKVEADSLRGLGCRVEVVDLTNYLNSHPSLTRKLSRYNAVWVTGGNVFVLTKMMRLSQFKLAIEPLLRSNEIIYGGYSAGACAAGSNIKGLDIVDSPEAIRKIGRSEVTWEPLGLVPYTVVPHFNSDHPKSPAMNKVVSFLDECFVPFKTLTDGQAIVVDGEKEEVV